MALTSKLQADIDKTQRMEAAGPAMQYRLSDFMDISKVLRQAGILQNEIVGQYIYIATLGDNGFETPLLLMGLHVQAKLDFVQQ